jgi:hypothetical protein
MASNAVFWETKRRSPQRTITSAAAKTTGPRKTDLKEGEVSGLPTESEEDIET